MSSTSGSSWLYEWRTGVISREAINIDRSPIEACRTTKDPCEAHDIFAGAERPEIVGRDIARPGHRVDDEIARSIVACYLHDRRRMWVVALERSVGNHQRRSVRLKAQLPGYACHDNLVGTRVGT